MFSFKNFSLVKKNQILVSIILICYGVIFFIVSEYLQKKALEEQMRSYTDSISGLFLKHIDTNLLEKLSKEKVDEDYANMIKQVDELATLTPLAPSIYFMYPHLDNNIGKNMISSALTRDKGDSEYGSSYELKGEFYTAFRKVLDTKKTVQTNIYQDEYGYWLTLLIPVMNSKNEMFAVFGVDLTAERVRTARKELSLGIIITLIIVIFLALILTYFIFKKVLSPTESILGGFKKLSEGNLNYEVKIDSKDELGLISDSLNATSNNLKKLISNLQSSAGNIFEISINLNQEIEKGKSNLEISSLDIHEIIEMMKRQNLRVNENTNSLNHLSNLIKEIFLEAENVVQSSEQMINFAEKGNNSLEETIKQNNAIQKSFTQTSKVIHELSGRVSQINEILTTIKEITDRTNLLSLNASIEAARAGDAGRGFSIVANEVSKLAEQAEDSTSMISVLVKDIQKSMTETVDSIQEGNIQIQKGIDVLENSKNVFQKINQSSQEVSANISSISLRTKKISESSQEAFSVAEELKNLTERTNLAAENLDKSSKILFHNFIKIFELGTRLNKTEVDLKTNINKFKL